MTKRQFKFLTMCLTLSHFYTKYEGEIQANPVLSRLFEEFFLIFGEIEAALQVQQGHTSEAAKLKQKEEQEMLEAVCRNAGKGYVYATERGLPGLIEKFSVSQWELQKLGDMALYEACISIYNALQGIPAADVAEYGIEAADLQTMRSEIEDFHALISKPRSQIITRSQATAKIDGEIKKLQTLLGERLDRMINSLPVSQRVMVNEYRAARMTMVKSGGEEEPATPTPPEQPKK